MIHPTYDHNRNCTDVTMTHGADSQVGFAAWTKALWLCSVRVSPASGIGSCSSLSIAIPLVLPHHPTLPLFPDRSCR